MKEGCCPDARGSESFCHLQRLDKGPEERPNALSFAEQFHQPQDSEQTEEGDGHLPALSFTGTLEQSQNGYVSVCAYVRVTECSGLS